MSLPNARLIMPARDVLALATLFTIATVVLPAPGPAPAAAQSEPWCLRIPLTQPDCRVLEVKALRTTLRLAVATNDDQRARGLMDVTDVPHAQGMLFAFPNGDGIRGFWMKDTITPLDMIWVRADGTIDTIAANVPATKPGTPDAQVATREGLGRYVIELRAGEAKRIGLVQGKHLQIKDIEAQ